MRRLQVDLSGLWRCVGQMGDPVARFMLDDEGDTDMQEIYRGKELLEIASRKGLETYARGGGPGRDFIVVGSSRSIQNLARQLEELERLRELLEQARDALEEASDHWMSDTTMAVLDELHMELNRPEDGRVGLASRSLPTGPGAVPRGTARECDPGIES